MRARVLLGCKIGVLVIFAGAVITGRPPSQAQLSSIPQPTSMIDAVQNIEIDNNKSALAAIQPQIAAMTAVLTDQGKDLASLNTKFNLVFGGAGILQIAVIVASFKKKEA